MSVDKEKLKSLAEAAISELNECGKRWPQDDDWFEPELCSDEMRYVKAASPDTVLALLAEIDRLKRALQEEEGRTNMSSRAHRVVSDKRDSVERERDQLKAENEALRKDAERYRWLREFTVKTLPVAGALDSLDRQIDAAMAKEGK